MILSIHIENIAHKIAQYNWVVTLWLLETPEWRVSLGNDCHGDGNLWNLTTTIHHPVFSMNINFIIILNVLGVCGWWELRHQELLFGRCWNLSICELAFSLFFLFWFHFISDFSKIQLHLFDPWCFIFLISSFILTLKNRDILAPFTTCAQLDFLGNLEMNFRNI